ncbi:RNA polymerase sigma-70 factor [Allomuricauda sp. XS_ASV26]|uniref:DNA-directed RNA polymerase sigma-70 factor n=1 Tax=Flagellimonas marinaquae TaxID=254955 RepID=A0AA48HKT9_9FLAO|nr:MULTISPECIES: RNA polymerase sigma-70 factor [Allomuricauda]MCA0957589.1 RNA polymerase sigma-70 factor [Allomuricauda ruestringensis]USD24488.1 RNA polymerase sigma-70 factor [Allomuricauda aquimarina]BDW93525.1 DNA-directed RNA polymerase sigma-70 factor [Allomuricauda aquimarina]
MDSLSVFREIQQKNQFVFKRFFEDTYEDLVQYADSYLFEKSISEDIVQEVFIYLWENASKIKIATSFNAYLFTMVRNRCLNHLKSIKITDRAKVLDMQHFIGTDYELDVFSEEDQLIIHNQVLKVVEMLPSKMQRIVRMKYIENYKYVDIAEELGISVNTVKTQLKRAKIRIAEQLITVIAVLLTK